MANELEYISAYEGTEIDAAVAFGKSPDSVPTPNSEVGVESGGVHTQLDGKLNKNKAYNKNLLCNPLFLIDQRDGYMLAPTSGGKYYTDENLTQNPVDITAYTQIYGKHPIGTT